MGVQILVKSSFQFIAICLLVKDCTPSFIRRQTLLFWTSRTAGYKLEISLLRYTILEFVLRTLQTGCKRMHWRRFCDIILRINCNILLLLTLAELIYHAFEFHQIQSGVIMEKNRQLISFAVFVLVFAILIFLRMMIKKCVNVLEVTIFGF